MTRPLAVCLAAISGALFGACADSAPPPADAVSFENVELRPPLGGRDVAAVYMDIRSPASDRRLLGASSPEAEVIEIHETTRDADGVASMRRLDSLLLPAGDTVVLQQGGLHLMVFGLTASEAADGIDLTLALDDGTSRTLTVLPEG